MYISGNHIVPASIRKIYNQFDAVSQHHALVYEVIVRLTLKATAEELEHTHPEVAQHIWDWIHNMQAE